MKHLLLSFQARCCSLVSSINFLKVILTAGRGFGTITCNRYMTSSCNQQIKTAEVLRFSKRILLSQASKKLSVSRTLGRTMLRVMAMPRSRSGLGVNGTMLSASIFSWLSATEAAAAVAASSSWLASESEVCSQMPNAQFDIEESKTYVKHWRLSWMLRSITSQLRNPQLQVPFSNRDCRALLKRTSMEDTRPPPVWRATILA